MLKFLVILQHCHLWAYLTWCLQGCFQRWQPRPLLFGTFYWVLQDGYRFRYILWYWVKVGCHCTIRNDKEKEFAVSYTCILICIIVFCLSIMCLPHTFMNSHSKMQRMFSVIISLHKSSLLFALKHICVLFRTNPYFSGCQRHRPRTICWKYY